MGCNAGLMTSVGVLLRSQPSRQAIRLLHPFGIRYLEKMKQLNFKAAAGIKEFRMAYQEKKAASCGQ